MLPDIDNLIGAFRPDTPPSPSKHHNLAGQSSSSFRARLLQGETP
jgi:hypothetical protein